MPFLLMAKPRSHVTLVTLNRPDRMNAMSFDVMIPFRQALEEISRDKPRTLASERLARNGQPP